MARLESYRDLTEHEFGNWYDTHSSSSNMPFFLYSSSFSFTIPCSLWIVVVPISVTRHFVFRFIYDAIIECTTNEA